MPPSDSVFAIHAGVYAEIQSEMAAQRLRDPVKARSTVKDWVDYLYRELQFGLRQAIGTRSLDTLLGNKGELDRTIYDYVRTRVEDKGIDVRGVGIKDLILPGEMKDLMNKVREALATEG